MDRQFSINKHSFKEIAVLMLISVFVVFVYGVAAKTYLDNRTVENPTDPLASIQG